VINAINPLDSLTLTPAGAEIAVGDTLWLAVTEFPPIDDMYTRQLRTDAIASVVRVSAAAPPVGPRAIRVIGEAPGASYVSATLLGHSTEVLVTVRAAGSP
jgi:hypothetical protein